MADSLSECVLYTVRLKHADRVAKLSARDHFSRQGGHIRCARFVIPVVALISLLDLWKDVLAKDILVKKRSLLHRNVSVLFHLMSFAGFFGKFSKNESIPYSSRLDQMCTLTRYRWGPCGASRWAHNTICVCRTQGWYNRSYLGARSACWGTSTVRRLQPVAERDQGPRRRPSCSWYTLLARLDGRGDIRRLSSLPAGIWHILPHRTQKRLNRSASGSRDSEARPSYRVPARLGGWANRYTSQPRGRHTSVRRVCNY